MCYIGKGVAQSCLKLNLMLCTEASVSFGHSLERCAKTQPRQISRAQTSSTWQTVVVVVVVCLFVVCAHSSWSLMVMSF